MGFFSKPKAPRGPSPEEIARREQAAREAERERQRLAEEKAKAEAQAEKEQALASQEQKRKAFAGKLITAEGEEESRKRFLKGA